MCILQPTSEPTLNPSIQSLSLQPTQLPTYTLPISSQSPTILPTITIKRGNSINLTLIVPMIVFGSLCLFSALKYNNVNWQNVNKNTKSTELPS